MTRVSYKDFFGIDDLCRREKIMEICMFNLEEFGRHYALVDRYADDSTLRYGIGFAFVSPSLPWT
jgi:hypothetical protein